MLTIHHEDPETYRCREVREARTYHMEVRGGKGRMNPCPVPGCEGGATTKFSMYQHFAWRHPEATIRIEGDGELAKCGLNGMHSKTIRRHQKTITCRRLRKRRENKGLQDLQANGGKVAFRIYGKEIERVREFTYLGRILTENDDDTKAIESQILKARTTWGSIVNILKQEGANPKTMAVFYRTVVQAVLLYGAETWVVSDTNLKKLRAFHHRAVRYMTRCHIRKLGDGEWEYPNQTYCGRSVEYYQSKSTSKKGGKIFGRF